MKKYLIVFNLGLQNTFVYRWNYFLRAVFGLIPLAGTIFLWRAVFNEPSKFCRTQSGQAPRSIVAFTCERSASSKWPACQAAPRASFNASRDAATLRVELSGPS